MDGVGSRLKEERKRLGHSQATFSALGKVSVNTQVTLEKRPSTLDFGYLARIEAAGVDLVYVLAGIRQTAEEAQLLAAYNAAPPAVRAAALAGLLAGASTASIQVAGDLGQNVTGNVNIKGGFNMGGKKK
ncbi:hypothetical protein YWS52_12020 [Chitiniphilus shinanonensis]